jgi:hypothetical protein
VGQFRQRFWIVRVYRFRISKGLFGRIDERNRVGISLSDRLLSLMAAAVGMVTSFVSIRLPSTRFLVAQKKLPLSADHCVIRVFLSTLFVLGFTVTLSSFFSLTPVALTCAITTVPVVCCMWHYRVVMVYGHQVAVLLYCQLCF